MTAAHLAGAPSGTHATALAPMRLRPFARDKVWGGHRLRELVSGLQTTHLPPEAAIGEAWLLADLHDAADGGRSTVDDGAFAGQPLRSVLAADPHGMLGHVRLSAEGGFPLLLKLLDAHGKLSVQVHPTAEYARRHPGVHVKDETWFVLEAKPGAVVYAGLRPGVGRDEVERRAIGGTLVDALVALPVGAGDVVDLPSGTCHALGEGIVVAEPQTPSDTTFRLFDWGRKDRALHVPEALEVLFGAADARSAATSSGPLTGLATVHPASARRAIDKPPFSTEQLCATPNYRVERIEVAAAAGRPALPVITDGGPLVLLPLTGGGLLAGGNRRSGLRRGCATFVPAALTGWELELEPGSVLLRIELPAPVRLA